MIELLNKETLDVVRKVAADWSGGVVILKPFNKDFVFIAVSSVIQYNPSDHIHHSTVEGRDISLMINQRLDVAGGTPSVITNINNIKVVESWEVPSHCEFYWIRVRVEY
jgi:hypothetical protein